MICPNCQFEVPRGITQCLKCSHEFTHRDHYPEQYSHPLVGKRVKVKTKVGHETEGVVERVVPSRFGQLVHLEGSGYPPAWHITDCTPI